MGSFTCAGGQTRTRKQGKELEGERKRTYHVKTFSFVKHCLRNTASCPQSDVASIARITENSMPEPNLSSPVTSSQVQADRGSDRPQKTHNDKTVWSRENNERLCLPIIHSFFCV